MNHTGQYDAALHARRIRDASRLAKVPNSDLNRSSILHFSNIRVGILTAAKFSSNAAAHKSL